MIKTRSDPAKTNESDRIRIRNSALHTVYILHIQSTMCMLDADLLSLLRTSIFICKAIYFSLILLKRYIVFINLKDQKCIFSVQAKQFIFIKYVIFYFLFLFCNNNCTARTTFSENIKCLVSSTILKLLFLSSTPLVSSTTKTFPSVQCTRPFSLLMEFFVC